MVTCPNAWLFSAPLHPYININVDVFDQRFTTRNVSPVFPLKFYERFRLSKGIIGPRLQLSICSFIREVRGTFDIPLDIHQKIPINRNFTSSKLIDNKASIICKSGIEKQVESDQMEDRPPFVVRRVDSKLISRLPSLYKEYEAKKAYCCYSPHRDWQCAACRMENSKTQSNHISQKSFRAPIAFVVGKEKNGIGGANQQIKLSHHSKLENQQSKKVATEPREIMRHSPERVPIERGLATEPREIMRHSPERVPSERGLVSLPASPIPFVYSPHVKWPDNTAANTAYRKSPIFNRPTFIERFGNNDVDIEDNFAKQKHNQVQTHLDQAQQTDYSYPGTYLEKHVIAPYTSRPFLCNCHHHLNYRYNYCSCPYCPVYWRNRFDTPALQDSRNYWKEYHHGLANIYDDLQSFS